MYIYRCSIDATKGLGQAYERFHFKVEDPLLVTDSVLKIRVVSRLPKEYVSWNNFIATLETGE